MTASGPFALGPALAGSTSSARRAVPKSNFTPIAAPFKGSHTSLGAGLTNTAAPTIKSELGKGKGKEKVAEYEEAYSDPDEGVEILDMEQVRSVDYMAPDILKQVKQISTVKKEDIGHGVDLANALDLSQGEEEEEELEDIVEDFNQQTELDEDPSLRQDRLYFFRFPSPFPTFESPSSTKPESSTSNSPTKKVSFAPDVKPDQTDAPEQKQKQDSERSTDGVIGRLEVYKSGAVKMRLSNGILLDVAASTQPSFLQHGVSVDTSETRIVVLGEINKHFTVSPDVDSLLTAMEAVANATHGFDDPELIRMDES